MWQRLPWLLILFVALIIVIMGAVAIWLLQQKDSQSNTNNPAQSLLDERGEKACGLPSTEAVAATEIVSITNIGFEPAEVAIKVGQTIRWENNGTSSHRIVVDPHPLHNQCIGLDSKKMQPKESFAFTFTKPGEWILHDEQQLSNQSKVIITE